MKYPEISKPIKIGSVTVKKRMMMAPMDTGFGNNVWGGNTAPAIKRFGVTCFGTSDTDNVTDDAMKAIEALEHFFFDTLGLESYLSKRKCTGQGNLLVEEINLSRIFY